MRKHPFPSNGSPFLHGEEIFECLCIFILSAEASMNPGFEINDWLLQSVNEKVFYSILTILENREQIE